MANFQTSVDIGNRALQHVGVPRILTLLDDTKAASAISFCYDKLREAELRRNVWVFAVRKAPLRPIDLTTQQLAPAAYNPATNYAHGAVVSYLGQLWESLVAANIGSTPGLDGSNWEVYCGPMTIRPFTLNSGATASDLAYYSGELVVGNGGADVTTVYRSLVSANSDIPPSAKWLSLGTVGTALSVLYPIGSGPSSQDETHNVFMLPNAYLRKAPQDPKAGVISWLGAPHQTAESDWVEENGLIVSGMSDFMVFRFVASVTRVPKFDPMFCEGLSARIGLEICEELTQSQEKLAGIGAQYKTFMSEARDVNGIENGPVEQPLDDWLTARI